MTFDADLLARLVGPVLGAVVGWWLKDYSERGPKLIAYYGHVGTFQLQPPMPQPGQPVGPPMNINAHTVVLRNAGKKSATAVRVSHSVFPPDVSVFPPVPYAIEALPGGNYYDLVIPELVPQQEVTINYLYPAPITYNQVTQGIRSKEGFAKVVSVLPTPKPPKWAIVVVWTLAIVGGLVVTYLLTSALIAGLTLVIFGP